MSRGRVIGIALATALIGVFIGRSTAPPAIPVQASDRVLSADEMKTAFDAILDQPRAFPRASALIRLVESLDADNVAGAVEAVTARSGRGDPVDLQIFLSAWVHFDPLAAVEEVRSWPIRSRRQIGLTIVMREWAANGGGLAAGNYYQSVRDPDERSNMGGPLVRGWALSGEVEPALDLAFRIWQTDRQPDVVDGLVRGILHGAGPETAFSIVRQMKPGERTEFEQRFARVALNLGAREDVEGAARIYAELAGDAEEEPAWLGQTMARITGYWSNSDPRATLDWLLARPETEARREALKKVMAIWVGRDFDSAWAWFERAGPGEDEAALAEPLSATEASLVWAVVRRMARTDPPQAAGWAVRLPEAEGREAMLVRVAHFWAKADEAAVRRWIADLDLSPARRAKLTEAADRGMAAAKAEQAEALAPRPGESQDH